MVVSFSSGENGRNPQTLTNFIMAVGFTTTYAISAHHHKRCEFEFRSWGGILNTTYCVV
jgi:hypothetical protein